MNKKENLIKKNFKLALQNHKKNNFQVAKNFYNKTLKLNPNYVEAYTNLGILHNRLGENQKALSCFKKAIQIDPKSAPLHNNLGFILNQLGYHKKAIKYLKIAIEIDFNYADAFYNLGISIDQLGENQKALDCYKKVIQIEPNYVAAHYKLGILYNQLGENQKALDCYEKVIQINQNHVGAYNNLGNTFQELGKYQDAMNFYHIALKINPNYSEAHNNLGVLYNQLGDYMKAKNCYENAIKINPNYVDAIINLAKVFNELGQYENSINKYNKAILIQPNNLKSHWLSINNFPVIYKDLEEIHSSRKNFEKNLKKLNKLLDKKFHYSKKQIISTLNTSTNFYLHYQGDDCLELQRSYAILIERMTEKIYGEINKNFKKNTSSKFIRVGFVSSFLKNHTVSKLFKNWILGIDQRYFKRFVYYIGDKFDGTTHKIKKDVDYFFNNTNVDTLINKISEDNLDVLVYLDIGMSPKIQILCSLRLAPVQCNTWGHPVTSGFKNIDYYISSELMEGKNSKNHYSEKLIKLPNLAINYDLPDINNIKKPNISKKLNRTIFLNLQSLFKLLPQDDHIYFDILKKKSNCSFWFIQGNTNSVTSMFKERISKLFHKEGYDFEKYFYFHPRCSQNEFFGLISEADIILDSLNWSGGNTSLEAISLNKPIVTYPSTFMRGRHTYAILKILDIEETIAKSKKEYVEISFKLANDNNFRNSIINKIKKNKNKLFSDSESIKFLEDFIRKSVLNHYV